MDEEDFIFTQRAETAFLKEEVRRLSEQIEQNNRPTFGKERIDILDLPEGSIGGRYGTLSTRLQSLTHITNSLSKGK